MAGTADPDVADRPPEALAAEVPWFRDLRRGSGAAEQLPRRLRDALATATRDTAVELGARVVLAREQAEEAQRAERARAERAERERLEALDRARRDEERREAESREMRRRADEAAERRRAAERLRRARARYWRVLAGAAVVCATALVPVLVGIATRDSLLRPRDPLVVDTSVRKGSDYFLSDWLAGTAVVVLVTGLLLLVVAVRDGRRGVVTGRGRRVRVALAVGVAAACVVPASVGRSLWQAAEADVVRTVTTQPVPDARMDCPGFPFQPSYRLDPGSFAVHDGGYPSDPTVFMVGGVAWRADLRTLAGPDETGALEVGVCLYSAWEYAGTVSLGRVGEPFAGAVYVSWGRPHGLVALETGAAEVGASVLHGAPLATHGAASGAAWTVPVPAVPARIEPAHGPRLVVGPAGPGTVGDLVSVGVDGVPVLVRAGADGGSWDVVDGTLYVIRGARRDGTPASLVELRPDLTVVWEAACPDGGAVTREGEGTFACGVGGACRADLAAREWVGAP